MRELTPLVFFDLDGVLVDSRAGITTCVDATLAAFGLQPVSRASVEAIIGPPLHAGFAQLLEQQGGPPNLAADCVAHYRTLYLDAALAGTVIVPGVGEMLAALERRATLAVATSKPLRFAEPILRHLGIRDAFGIVMGPTPETDGESKTQTLQRAIELVVGDGAARAPAFMVGDRSHDMLAAVATGLVGIGAAWGFGSEAELRAAGASVVARAPRDIVPLVLAANVAP